MQHILSKEEMVSLEEEALSKGISPILLMERAGRAVAEEIYNRYNPKKVLILAGPGNNGGDGYVVANELQKKDVKVIVAEALNKNPSEGYEFHKANFNGKIIDITKVGAMEIDLIVDALFGIGLTRELDEFYQKLFVKVNQFAGPIIAVDIPSGINANNGKVMGAAIKASLTITFAAYKLGHLMLPGKKYCGEIVVKDIGLGEIVEYSAIVNQLGIFKLFYKLPELDTNKYKRGFTLVFGSDHMSGASRIAALTARISGSGIVKMLIPEESIDIYGNDIGNVLIPVSRKANLKSIFADKRINAVLIGPGLEPDQYTRKKVVEALKTKHKVVIDAGAITAFVGKLPKLQKYINNNAVLTPHEGEFERLFSDIKGDKLSKALRAAEKLGAVIILKGNDTIIVSPEGKVLIEKDAPLWLATAGTGDALSGIVASLIAQGMPLFEASAMAVDLHKEAANKAGPYMIVEDLINALKVVMKDLANNYPNI